MRGPRSRLFRQDKPQGLHETVPFADKSAKGFVESYESIGDKCMITAILHDENGGCTVASREVEKVKVTTVDVGDETIVHDRKRVVDRRPIRTTWTLQADDAHAQTVHASRIVLANFRAMLRRMHGHATLLALIVPGLVGCEPSLRAPEEPRGYGDERPISHPPLVEGRRTNRRIEFVILP